MGLSIVITGGTGMVGEGVMLHCLRDPRVDRVLSVSRKPSGHVHPKLTELIVADFRSVDDVEPRLVGWDACFYCAGISSAGMSESEYAVITYDTPVAFAQTLARLNPTMVLVHVSGRSTDASETGRVMWARVKGRAENALSRLPFRAVHHFRPALMKPVEGQRHLALPGRLVAATYPLWKALFPGSCLTLDEVGDAIIHAVTRGSTRSVLEVAQIAELSRE